MTITWLSKRQNNVAQPTTDSEFVSASECAREILWLSKLFVDCFVAKSNEKYLFMVDNKSTI